MMGMETDVSLDSRPVILPYNLLAPGASLSMSRVPLQILFSLTWTLSKQPSHPPSTSPRNLLNLKFERALPCFRNCPELLLNWHPQYRVQICILASEACQAPALITPQPLLLPDPSATADTNTCRSP
jgi:hypothetical protein